MPGGDSGKEGSSKTGTKTKTTVVSRKLLSTTGDDSALCGAMAILFALVGTVCIVAARRLRLR